ncbi:MAG: archaellin/type IV pilin N-terminal domain-containing protein [Nanoarchaeota archaeon]
MQKKGLSPVIATMLLLLITVVLAIIILIWARSFIAEKTQKDLGSGPEAIELLCDDIKFESDVIVKQGSVSVAVVNKGSIPIYAIELRKKSRGFVEIIGVAEHPSMAIKSGNDATLKIETDKLIIGDNVIVVPVLLGESGKTKKAYTCNEDYGFVTEAVL